MQDEEIKIFLNNTAKLEWSCRRGMLELDVLLGNFLKEAYPGLAVEDKMLFIELLSLPDPDLFAWLMGHETPKDERIARMTKVIRDHARSRL